MSATTTPDPKLRWGFAAAMSLALLFSFWAAYVRARLDPNPKWTELQSVPLEIVFGFWVLFYPMPGMVGNIRRFMLAIFFGTAAFSLFQYFKGA